MKLESKLRQFFDENDYRWVLSNGTIILPDEDDFEKFLDEAVKHLYNEEIGARLTVGKLIVEKIEDAEYDVYVYVGSFT